MKYTYKECETIREVDLSRIFNYNLGKTILKLRDFTAHGYNNINPHPAYVKYYQKNPYWVQITDEDDFIFQKEFSNLPEAQKFFEDFLDNPKLKLSEME